MSFPLVTTIIPVYNRPQMVRRAVQSVLDQSYRPIEVIVVDDGSTDGTIEVAERLALDNAGLVRTLHQPNSGPGPARELGRQNARGSFIQYLDSDDRLLPNKFADQVTALEKHPECGIAFGVTRLVDANGNVLADPFKWTARRMETLFPGLLVDRWWCTHTPLYRREVTDKIGAWTDMRWSQDWEYDARAGGMGVRLVHCGSHVSEHVHHDGARQTSVAAWGSDPVRLRNRVELLSAIWKNAAFAKVPTGSRETQHFARWCFAIARQCAARDMLLETNHCMSLVDAAALPGQGGRTGVTVFRAAVRLMGAKAAARMFSSLAYLKPHPSAMTLDQSFAKQITSRSLLGD